MFQHFDHLITQLSQLPSYRDDGILILFSGSISLQAGINVKKNWRACSRVKPMDGDHTRPASDWHSYRIHNVGISFSLKEVTWNGQPENAINIYVKIVKSSPVGVPAENILLH